MAQSPKSGNPTPIHAPVYKCPPPSHPPVNSKPTDSIGMVKKVIGNFWDDAKSAGQQVQSAGQAIATGYRKVKDFLDND